jgi:hypothetical protein
LAPEEDLALRRRLQTEDDSEYGRLAGAVGPDEARELSGMKAEADIVEDLPAGKPQGYTLESEDFLGVTIA